MVVVFSFMNRMNLEYALSVAAHRFDYEEEDFNYCMDRERAKEILTLRELGLPYVVFDSDRTKRESNLLDSNINLASIAPETVLVDRTHQTVFNSPLAHLKSFITPEQRHGVDHWPSSIKDPDRFLKRSVFEFSHQAFTEMFHAQTLPLPSFIKGVSKGSQTFSLHHVFNQQKDLGKVFMTAARARQLHAPERVIEGLGDDAIVAVHQHPDWHCPYRETIIKGRVEAFVPHQGVIISDVLEIESKNDIRQEFRAYIINGQVTSLSAYVDYKSVPVPPEVCEVAQQFAAANADLAPAMVADFAVTNRGVVLIEMNDFCKSGRYLDNDPVALYEMLYKQADLSRYTFVDPLPVPNPERHAAPSEKITIDFDM